MINRMMLLTNVLNAFIVLILYENCLDGKKSPASRKTKAEMAGRFRCLYKRLSDRGAQQGYMEI